MLAANARTFSIVAFQANAANRRVEDAIQFVFTTNFMPRFGVRYFTRNGDSTEFIAARVGLRKLVEYVETGADNSGFDPETDTRVQDYYLWNQTWTDLSFQNQVNNGAQLKSVCTETVDGVVQICLFAADIINSLTVNGTSFTIDPNAISHTFVVKNFPFLQTDTKLALKHHLDSRTRAVDAVTEDPTQLNAGEDAIDLGDSGSTFRPVFAWSTSVNVTGTGCSAVAPVVRSVVFEGEVQKDIDVVAPGTEDELDVTISLKRRIIYHSFITDCAKPEVIFWDPDFGVADTSSVAAFVPCVALVLALLAFFL